MQDKTVPEPIDRPGCAAAAAGVYCSPACFRSRGRDCEHPLPTPAAEPQTTPEPDYWQDLAADLRAAADRIGSLAGTPAPDIYPTLSVHVGLYVAAGHEERRPMVDAIAAALDASPADVMSGPFWERRARGQLGALRITASTRIPAPEDAELVALRARVAELEAERAGGAR